MILGSVFAVTNVAAILFTIFKLFLVFAKIKRAIADPVRLEITSLSEQFEEIKERKLSEVEVESGSSQQVCVSHEATLTCHSFERLPFSHRAEMLLQRDAMTFYRGFLARAAVDNLEMSERVKPPSWSQPPPPPAQPPHMKFGMAAAEGLSPVRDRRHRGERAKKPNAASATDLDVAMLVEEKEAATAPSLGSIVAEHRDSDQAFNDGVMPSGSGDFQASKKPTPTPRNRSSFTVEASVHSPDNADL